MAFFLCQMTEQSTRFWHLRAAGTVNIPHLVDHRLLMLVGSRSPPRKKGCARLNRDRAPAIVAGTVAR